MKECLTGLVGVASTDSECCTVNEELRSSSFGLWVEDHDGIDMELVKNALGCGDDLVTNYNKLYSSAINFFESDLQVGISSNHKQKFTPYVGRIGERKYDKPLTASPLVGIKLGTQNVESASIVVKSVYLYFNGAGQITLQVYKNDELLDVEYVIDVVEGETKHDLATPLNLPLVENGYRNEYYFVYAPGALQPMNNKTSCSCNGIESVRRNFLKPYGVYGNTIDDISIDSNYAYGISLEVVISCSLDNLLCDFTLDHTFYMRMAMAVWYKVGQLVIEALFASREINYDVFSNRDYLYTGKKKFESNYSNLISWLAENSSIEQSNCFVCNSSRHMTMGKILM